MPGPGETPSLEPPAGGGQPPAGGSDLAARVVKDPANPPSTLLLQGFLGDSTEADHRRLYLDPLFSSYVDIPNDAILHTQDAPEAAGPLAGTHVWINRDAQLLHGQAGTGRVRASFLEGPIYSDYLSRMQAGAGAAGAGAAGAGGLVTHPPICPGISQLCAPTWHHQCPPTPLQQCPTPLHPLCPPSPFHPACPPSPFHPYCPPTPLHPYCPPTPLHPICPTPLCTPQCPPTPVHPCPTPLCTPQCPPTPLHPICPTPVHPCVTPGHPVCPTPHCTVFPQCHTLPPAACPISPLPAACPPPNTPFCPQSPFCPVTPGCPFGPAGVGQGPLI